MKGKAKRKKQRKLNIYGQPVVRVTLDDYCAVCRRPWREHATTIGKTL